MTRYGRLLEGIKNHVTVRELSLLYVEYVLEEMGGHKVKTALKIDVDRRSIQRWLKGRERTPNAPADSTTSIGADA